MPRLLIKRLPTLSFFLAAMCAATAPSSAQEVDEPPIPITIICPYHEDSLRRAYEAGLGGRAYDQAALADSIGRTLIRSNEALADSVHESFLLVYVLLGLMSLITLAALRAAYRLKIELQEVRDTRRILPLALPEPRDVASTPIRATQVRKRAHPKKSKTSRSKSLRIPSRRRKK